MSQTRLISANVLCDDCKVEMYYTNPNVVLTSNPPVMVVGCPDCKKTTYKRV
jgi:hypothetical protein